MKDYEPYKAYQTRDYSRFKNYPQQRDLDEKHIEELMNDPRFPIWYKTQRTTVKVEGDYLMILTGNHRFHAAKRLGNPIHFEIDPVGSIEDMAQAESHTKFWDLKTHLIHQARFEKKSYVSIVELMDKHKITLTFINSVIQKMLGYSPNVYGKKLKDGILDISNCKNDLISFLDDYIIPAKKYITLCGKSDGRALFSRPYIFALTHFYLTDRQVFKRFIEKLPTFGDGIPYCVEMGKAREQVYKMSKVKRSKKSSNDPFEQLDFFDQVG